jgi:hypothetical protein
MIYTVIFFPHAKIALLGLVKLRAFKGAHSGLKFQTINFIALFFAAKFHI